MADQDYPVLYTEMKARLVEMKATIQIAQEIIYASTGTVDTPVGPQASVAKRVEDRMAQITGQAPITWTSITDKPVSFPGSWDLLANKPANFPTQWSLVTSKPSSFPSDWSTLANKPSSFPSDWSTLANKPVLFESPMTAKGDLIVGGVSGAPVRLPSTAVTVGYVLTVTNAGVEWHAPVGGTVNWSDIQNKPALIVNPMAAKGDLIVGGTDGAATALSGGETPAGAVLTWTGAGNLPAWQPPAQVQWTSVQNKPTSFPSDWSTMANKPSVIDNPMTSVGDIIIGASGGTPARLAGAAATGHVLTWTATGPVWAASSGGGSGGGSVSWADVLDKPTSFPSTWDTVTGKPTSFPSDWSTMANKPTLFSSPLTAKGQLIIGDTGGVAIALPVGDTDQVLTVKNGAPAWAAAPSGGGGGGSFTGGTLTKALNEAPFITKEPGTNLVINADDASNTILITGTATVNNFVGTAPVGSRRTLIFTSGVILSAAAGLSLPGQQLIAAMPGDTAEFICTDTNAWRCLRYTRADGGPVRTETTVSVESSFELTYQESRRGGLYIRTTGSSPISIPIRGGGDVPIGTEYTIEQGGTGPVSIVTYYDEVINRMAGTTNTIAGRYGVVTVRKVANPNTWTLFGALGAS